MHDLRLTGGRVIDPEQGIDAIFDVAFKGRVVSAIGPDLGPTHEMRNVAGQIVTPGLIDIHTHV